MEIENQMTVTKFPYYKNLPIYECSISSGSKILVIIDHAPCIVIVYYVVGTKIPLTHHTFLLIKQDYHMLTFV